MGGVERASNDGKQIRTVVAFVSARDSQDFCPEERVKGACGLD